MSLRNNDFVTRTHTGERLRRLSTGPHLLNLPIMSYLSRPPRVAVRRFPPTSSSYLRRVASVGGAAGVRRAQSAMARRMMAPAVLPRRSSVSMHKELNFLDTVMTAVNVDDASLVQLLNGMAQGTTASTRIGRKIDIKSIQSRLNIQAQATAVTQQIACCVVFDTQANGVAPTWQDVFDNSTALGANRPWAMRNMSNAQRFQVIWYEKFNITGATAAGLATDETNETIEKYNKCDLVTQYNAGVAGTIADIQTGSLYFMAVSSAATGSTVASTLTGTIRIRYAD